MNGRDDREELLSEINEVSFAMDELRLSLTLTRATPKRSTLSLKEWRRERRSLKSIRTNTGALTRIS